MKLPGGQGAVVPLEKLLGYALAPSHAVGGPKARLFRAAFGIGPDDAAELTAALLKATANEPAYPKGSIVEGDIYRVDFVLHFAGRHGRVRSGWIVPANGEPTRLVTVFPLRR